MNAPQQTVAKPAKYRSFLIDTISQLQDDQYVTELAEATSAKLEFDDWKNHGQYVSCVVKEANSLRKAGLITKEQRNSLVKQAAKSDVGKKT